MTIDRIVVVIPARNEEELVEGCLLSVAAAAMAAAVPTRIVLVADRCTDATAAIARSVAGVRVLETPFANVGAARAAGVRYAMGSSTGADWVANTDADSSVPTNWLTAQLDAAAAGFDLVIGTVRPRFSDLSPQAVQRWKATHSDGQALGHIHGANLGILAARYVEAGGFSDDAEHEDVSLVRRVRMLGARALETGTIEVETSGRFRGRTPGGYAAHLAETSRDIRLRA